MIQNIRQTLNRNGADTQAKVVSYSEYELRMTFTIPSLGNQVWEFVSEAPIHIDIAPFLTLIKVEFGDLNLLANSYKKVRNFDHGIAPEDYTVVRVIDIEEKYHFLILNNEGTFNLKEDN